MVLTELMFEGKAVERLANSSLHEISIDLPNMIAVT